MPWRGRPRRGRIPQRIDNSVVLLDPLTRTLDAVHSLSLTLSAVVSATALRFLFYPLTYPTLSLTTSFTSCTHPLFPSPPMAKGL